MKKIIALNIVVLFFLASFSQQDSIQLLYKRFPTPPPFKLLLTDSTTIFTDKNLKKYFPVLIMAFSPDCDHCQHHAEELVKNQEALLYIQIVMSSTQSLEKIRDFYSKYQLDKMENLVIGQDREFILSTFYKMKSLPFLAFYDNRGKLIDVFEGALPVDKILAYFKK